MGTVFPINWAKPVNLNISLKAINGSFPDRGHSVNVKKHPQNLMRLSIVRHLVTVQF